MNTRKRSAVVVLVASLALLACDEQLVPTQQSNDAAPRLEVPGDGRRIVVVGDEPPATAPAAYQQYTWINVTADAGWLDANTSYGQSIVEYGANNATADVNLIVRNSSGTIIASNTGHAADTWVFPGDHTLRTSTTAYVTPTCGSTAQATAGGAAFDTWFSTSQSILRWGDKSDSDTKSAPQASCPPPPTCQDVKATNYGGPLPCTYQTSGGTYNPPPPTYPGAYYPPPPPPPPGPWGHWECTFYDAGNGYQIQACVWISGSYDRLASRPMSLSRIATPGAPARAQSSADLTSVFVIVSDQLPADAIGIIERHRTGPFRNVLLVPSAAIRPAVFVAAMQALYDSRDKDGEVPAKELSITLRGSILDQQVPSTDRAYAAAFAAQIASAKKGDAGSYGFRPMVEFKLGARR